MRFRFLLGEQKKKVKKHAGCEYTKRKQRKKTGKCTQKDGKLEEGRKKKQKPA